ncbi:MAG: sensor histidine kinase [Chloroflexi bacterium]|nr:sensor histidine kinase [Chloroflexota bacterium]
MKESNIERGLLPVFRLYVGLRWLILIYSVFEPLVEKNRIRTRSSHFFILSLTEVGLLSLYLFWPWLQRKLGRWYLPIALVTTSVMQIVEVGFLLRHSAFMDDIGQLAFVWEHTQQLRMLLFPLFLIGWQYDVRTVLFFSFGTALLQIAVFTPIMRNGSPLLIEFIWEELVMRTIVFIIVGYLVVRLMNIQRRQRQALAEANDRVVAYAATLEQLAISRERNRMARELHDTLAHTLSGLAVQLDSVTTLWDSIPSQAGAMLEQSLVTIRSGLDETRRALQALRATPLEDLGLALAIRTLAEEVVSRGKLSLEIELPKEVNNLPPEVEHCVYRVAQEALENVVRHADAQKVTIYLMQTDEYLMLTISDDGIGFTTETAAQNHQLGIKGMRERVEMISATLDIKSQAESGTTVNLVWRQSL